MRNLPVTGNRIVDLSFEFALNIISFSEKLRETNKYVIANQIIRSGTSIGAGVREAQNCESKADFIHKLKISAKEAEQTEYCLLLCQYSKDYHFEENLLFQVKEIQKILNSIINSSKKMLK